MHPIEQFLTDENDHRSMRAQRDDARAQRDEALAARMDLATKLGDARRERDEALAMLAEWRSLSDRMAARHSRELALIRSRIERNYPKSCFDAEALAIINRTDSHAIERGSLS